MLRGRMSMKVTLRVVTGPVSGRVFTFEQHDAMVFGRHSDCHVRVEGDSYVSRHHFLLEVNPPAARIRDLGSRNGTVVNGKRIGPRTGSGRFPEADLRHGDKIQVGRTGFVLELESPQRAPHAVAEPSTAAAPPPPTAPAAAPQPPKSVQPAPPSAVPGWHPVGEYEAVARLGTGGMGDVFLARRHGQPVWVALKVLLSQVALDDTGRKRFERECDLLDQLVHPNIVAFEERGRQGSVWWFAMEFCPGGSVADLLARRGGRLSLGEAGPIALGALEGLAYAHTREVTVRMPEGDVRRQQGVVHRDIKPRNILLTGANARWTPKLSDFGLAKCFQTAGLSGCTLTSDAAGALPYMPREQLLDFRFVTPVSDVWSMGATIYEMLTGVPPREHAPGRDPLEVILGECAVPIRKRAPEIPARVAETIDRALAENPKHRYVNAAEFRDAFEAAVYPRAPKSHASEAPTGVVLLDAGSANATTGAAAVAFVLARASPEGETIGETWLSSRIRRIHEAMQAHPSARAAMHVRTLGDGLLVVYDDAASALDAARTLRADAGGERLALRRAIHCADVQFESADAPRWADVDPALRAAAAAEDDRVEDGTAAPELATGALLVLTAGAMERLPASLREDATRAGSFRAQGAAPALELWTAPVAER